MSMRLCNKKLLIRGLTHPSRRGGFQNQNRDLTFHLLKNPWVLGLCGKHPHGMSHFDVALR